MDPRTQFCHNMACPARGKIGEGNIVIHSRKDKRYKCTVCEKTFVESRGTPFYWLRHPTELFTIVVTLIAYGCPVQAIVVAFKLDERTVMDWQKRAGQHCRKVHEHLVQQPRDLEHVQADEIRIKAQGKVLWLAMAIMVRTRLWLGGVISTRRDEQLIARLIGIVRTCALARPLLFCVDGLITRVKSVSQPQAYASYPSSVSVIPQAQSCNACRSDPPRWGKWKQGEYGPKREVTAEVFGSKRPVGQICRA